MSIAIITRARRQAAVTRHIQSLTRALRSLPGATHDHARAVANHYARHMRLPAPSDALLDYLRSQDATTTRIEELDALFGDDEAEAITTSFGAAASAIQRARR